MSTAYYLYEIPDGNTTLEECLEKKELIGILTCQGKQHGSSELERVFIFAMQPGDFFYHMAFFGDFHAVMDEYRHLYMLPTFYQDVLGKCKVIEYDWRKIPS